MTQDDIHGSDLEEVLSVRAWSDAMLRTHPAAHTPLQVYCAECEHGSSSSAQSMHAAGHSMRPVANA